MGTETLKHFVHSTDSLAELGLSIPDEFISVRHLIKLERRKNISKILHLLGIVP